MSGGAKYCPVCAKRIEKQKYDLRYRRTRFRNRYNITVEDYERVKEEQGGKCAICREKCKVHKSLSVDHEHGKKKNSFRGLLCSNFNRALGLFGDSLKRLKSAARYLSDPPARRAGGSGSS